MIKAKQVTPTYSFDKPIYVKCFDRTDFSLIKYNDISLEGFSCFCRKPMEIGEQLRVEINLKMISGGLIDDMDMHIARAELVEIKKMDNKNIYQFKFMDFGENCFENLVKALDYLDQKEKLIALPDISEKNIDAQDTISDIVKNLSDLIKKGQISLPVLPKIVQEIEAVIKNPNSKSDDIAKVIERDAVISVKLISTANSPLYRGTSHIVTIKETIPRIGLNEVQNLVLTIANKSLYNTKNKQYKKLLEKLWLHSLACAVSAKAIALKLGLENTDSYFTVGLVHDIGQTMLFRVIGEMTSLKKSFDTNDIIESTNKHKAELCAVILHHWKFEDDFIVAVAKYKETQFDKTTNKMTLVINIANYLTYNIGYGIRDDKVDLAGFESVKLLKISPEILKEIEEETKATMKEATKAF